MQVAFRYIRQNFLMVICEIGITASALNSQKKKLAFRLIIYLGLYFSNLARTLWWVLFLPGC